MSAEIEKKIVLKIKCGEWKNESRDRRELSLYRELGAEIVVMAKKEEGDKLYEDTVDGFRVLRMGTRPLGENIPAGINRLAAVFIWAHAVRKIQKDVISGHNIGALFIGWLSTIFVSRKNRPQLIYDSHEFEIEKSGKRSVVCKAIIIFMEGFLMRRCAFSIMVNDSIADKVQQIHKLKQRPIVVRNIPPYWEVDEKECKNKHREFCRQLKMPDFTFIVMYHGAIMEDRGIESIIEQVSLNDNIAGVILGDCKNEVYLHKLHRQVSEMKVKNRIIFHKAVPVDELWRYVGAANVGIITVRNVCDSYRYMLPNKFFENIQSLTPVIASDFPEIGRIIKKYDIGMVCNPDDQRELSECIEKMRTDKKLYDHYKFKLTQVKEKFCWEKEKEILAEAYASMITA